MALLPVRDDEELDDEDEKKQPSLVPEPDEAPAAAPTPSAPAPAAAKSAKPLPSDLDLRDAADASTPRTPGRPTVLQHMNQEEAPTLESMGPSNDNQLQPMGEPAPALKPLDFHERQALPLASPGAPSPVSSAYQENKLERLEDQAANPLGSAENHPGFWGKLAHGLGEVGNVAGSVLAHGLTEKIPGTQLNREMQEDQAKKDYGIDKTREDKEAIDEERERHDEQTEDLGQQKVDAVIQKAEDAENKNKSDHEIALRKLGLKPDPADPTRTIPLTREDMSETEQAALDVKGAQAQASQARAALDQVRADPNSPQNKATLERIRVMAKNASTAAAKLGLDADKFKADYFGLDKDDNPIPGTTVDEKTGQPIGPRIQKGNAANAPGTERLKRADLAQSTTENGTSIIKIIQDNPNLFGKLAGRYTTFEQAMGSDDPAVAQLATLGHNYAIASNGMHGIRSQQGIHDTEVAILNHYKNSPEATIAALQAGLKSGKTFIDAAKMGKQPLPENYGANAGADEGNQAAAPIAAPPGKTTVYDPQGKQHFVNSDAKDKFLKDPKYKGWH